MTDLDNPMVIFYLAMFRELIGVKVGPKTQFWGTSCRCKLHLYNYEESPWSKFQDNLMFFTRVIASNSPKWIQ